MDGEYNKYTFKARRNENGEMVYYMLVGKEYVQVPYDVYCLCKASFQKVLRSRKRDKQYGVGVYIDGFHISEKDADKAEIKFLYDQVMDEINNLSEDYREIAIYTLVEQYSIDMTSRMLKISRTTVFRKRKEIIRMISSKFSVSD